MTKLIKDGVVITYQQFLALYPNITFPLQIPYADYGWNVVFPKPQPSHNELTHKVIPADPVLTPLGEYEEAWEVVALTQEEAAERSAAKQASDEKTTAENIGRLWQAAHDYEYQHINGMAIGLLTVGVLQNSPKALAIKAWSSAIWDLYYTRKILITPTLDPQLLDFSSVGPMPHSVPELRAEVGL